VYQASRVVKWESELAQVRVEGQSGSTRIGSERGLQQIVLANGQVGAQLFVESALVSPPVVEGDEGVEGVVAPVQVHQHEDRVVPPEGPRRLHAGQQVRLRQDRGGGGSLQKLASGDSHG
jgi:hypothetical protein